MRWVLCLCLSLLPLGAAVRDLAFALDAAPDACSLLRPANSFDASSRQIFTRFIATRLRQGDSLQIDWLDPSGQPDSSARYEALPAAASMCFLSQLPVAGMNAAAKPGQWTLRVSINSLPVSSATFTITGDPRAAAFSIRSVAYLDPGQLAVDARSAGSETSVNVARFSASSGWQYLAHLLPERFEGSRLFVTIPTLEPGEYLVLLRNADGQLSPPARFTIASPTGYQRPHAPAEPWRVTQGPNGAYSHWGRASFAYDLAPVNGRFVNAMRAGVVKTADLGLGQTPRRRIFGNYISIDHGDGEFSHYAHLKTGTFLVRSGQRVEAGQPLAIAGNSGYSFGVHVHVQVTRQPNIAAQSIPFRFGAPLLRTQAPADTPTSQWRGKLALASWWHQPLSVPQGQRVLDVKAIGGHFELYLTSPSGRYFMPSDCESPKHCRVPQPEPGAWRVSLQAVQGREDQSFAVTHNVAPAPSRKLK